MRLSGFHFRAQCACRNTRMRMVSQVNSAERAKAFAGLTVAVTRLQGGERFPVLSGLGGALGSGIWCRGAMAAGEGVLGCSGGGMAPPPSSHIFTILVRKNRLTVVLE